MNKRLKKTLLILGSILLSGSVIALPFSLLSINSNSIVIGNFQSYMSPTVMENLSKEYNINWQYYSSNAEIPTYIQNKTLDLAVATNNMVGQLIVQDSIQPIEWERFGLINPKTNMIITDYSELENFVTPITWSLCEIIGQSIGINNLLEYCIPYFCQDLVFGYNGKQIDDERMNENSNFQNIFSYITDINIKNNRFLSGNSSVMMIKDARTVFDVCNLINEKDINPINATISKDNKNNIESPTIDQMDQIYNTILNYYNPIGNKNTITFNSDSNIVLNKFANNEINGAFFYNGDAIYSLMGGDNVSIADDYTVEEINEWTSNKHMIIPNQNNNFIAMDAFVINKSLDDSKKDDVYNIIKSISFDFNYNDVDENDDYVSLTMQNFDYVNYTPCYIDLYDYVINDYFKECFPNNPNLSSLLEKLISIDNIVLTKENIELPINNLADSNMNIAFTTFIDKI